MVVLGFVMNRINVSITGLEGYQGARYVPSLGEGIITMSLVAAGVAAFALAVRYLPVMHHVEEPELVPAPAEAPVGVLTAAPARS